MTDTVSTCTCTARVDDFWSLLYIVDELLMGALPWSNDVDGGSVEEYGEVYRKKLACIDDPRRLACGGLRVPGMYGILKYYPRLVVFGMYALHRYHELYVINIRSWT
jgi:hypothetical protein